MKNKTLIIYIMLMGFLLLDNQSSWGWDDKVTHKSITDFAAENSKIASGNGDYLKQLGFKYDLSEKMFWAGKVCDDDKNQSDCSAKDWLRYGAEKEDASIRSLNHFHDPYRDAGLSDVLALMDDGISALSWAQDSPHQTTALEGDQSWLTLRQIYSIALRHPEESTRCAFFAQLFKGLGHQMHLVQDMAVPYHVRNDAHAEDAIIGISPLGPLYFERWAKKNFPIINALAAGPAVSPTLDFANNYAASHGGPATCPASKLWDSDVYTGTNPSTTTTEGIAEFTKENFKEIICRKIG